MLKNFLYGPAAEFVALEGYMLTVRVSQPLKAQQVRLRVQRDERTTCVRFRSSTSREVPGGYVYTGLVTQGWQELAPGWRALAPDEQGFLRAGERVSYSARVLSRDLPNFRGVTIDFCPGGLQLEVEGPVEVGSLLHLTLDQGYDTPGLSLKARVAWCSQGTGRCRLGAEFFFLEASQRKAIERLYASLSAGRHLSVSQRLSQVHRQGADQWGSGPVCPVSCVCEGEILGYSQSRAVLTVNLGYRELIFAGLSSVHDRQGSAGLQLSRLEFNRQPAGWSYRLLSPRAATVLEINCETCPDELLGPDLQARPSLQPPVNT